MSFGDDEIAAAGRYLGMQYSWGGGDYDGPTKGIKDGGVADRYGDYDRVGFDCSGLVLFAVYQASGGRIRLPHRANLQRRKGDPVPMGEQQPGDVAFFGDAEFVHHTGIYIGHGQIRNAPQSGSPIADMKLSRWPDLYCFRRFGEPAGRGVTPDRGVVALAAHHPQESWWETVTLPEFVAAAKEAIR